MNDNPFKWLHLVNKNRDKVENEDPETWFYRWLRIELMIIAIGFGLLLGVIF